MQNKIARGSGSCVISCRRIFSYQILTRHSSVQPRSKKNQKKFPASPNPNGLSIPNTLAASFLSLRDVLNARRGNLLANRSPHCVRDDNLLLDGFISFAMTTLNLPQAPCHCDGVKRQKQSTCKSKKLLIYT